MEPSAVRVAAVQAAPVFLDLEASVAKACALVREAGRHGAQVIGFPEGFIPAHPYWLHFFPAVGPNATHFAERLYLNSLEVPSPHVEALCAAARDANAYVVVGFCERSRDSGGTLYNSQLFISSSGAILGKHQKTMPTHAERVVHAPGRKAYAVSCFDTDLGGRIGGLICGEHYNPLARFALIARGELFHVASWPANFAAASYRYMHEAKNFLARAHAFEGKVFVINASGILSDEIFDLLVKAGASAETIASRGGGSAIIAPNGDFLAGPAPDGEEMVLYADLDLRAALRGKLMSDVAGHYQRPDIYRLVLDTRDSPLVIEKTAPAGEESVAERGSGESDF